MTVRPFRERLCIVAWVVVGLALLAGAAVTCADLQQGFRIELLAVPFLLASPLAFFAVLLQFLLLGYWSPLRLFRPNA